MASPAQRAIAILIDMAQQGEIDPWDVKVVEVIDRFFIELNLDSILETSLGPGQAPNSASYEANLSESGQAFLYASMLVLLKADTLARLEAEPEEAVEEFDLLENVPNNVIPLPLNLEQQIRRRAVAQPPAQRRVTLPELVEQLELMAVAIYQPKRPKVRRPKPPSERQTTQAINQLSQQENPAELAAVMEVFLQEQWHHLVRDQDGLDFEALVAAWTQHRQAALQPTASEPVADRVGVFWSLLLLSAHSKVELCQTNLYESLQIRLIPTFPENLGQPSLPLPLASP
jgi:segregation and condensation protein A